MPCELGYLLIILGSAYKPLQLLSIAIDLYSKEFREYDRLLLCVLNRPCPILGFVEMLLQLLSIAIDLYSRFDLM